MDGITELLLNTISSCDKWNFDGEPATFEVGKEQVVIRNSHGKIVWFSDYDNLSFTYNSHDDYDELILMGNNDVEIDLDNME